MHLDSRSLLAAAACVALPTAHAQKFPERPLRMIVPFFAGCNTDMIARTTGEGLGRVLGQPVVIDNKPGAGRLLALNELVRAKPDGYSLALGTPSTQIITTLVSKEAKVDALKETQPICMLCGPLVLVVHAGLPVDSVADLVAYARTNPGKLSFASDGVGTSTHLAMEMFCMAIGAQMVHVPYKASYSADMANGLVHLAIAGARSQIALAEAGKSASSRRRRPNACGSCPRRRPLSRPRACPTSTRRAGFLAQPGGPSDVAATMARDRKKWSTVVDTLNLKI
jgi:tripartite-type tricarboxylate transporter receptor subunit TctC